MEDSAKSGIVEKREYETKDEAKQAFKDLLREKVMIFNFHC